MYVCFRMRLMWYKQPLRTLVSGLEVLVFTSGCQSPHLSNALRPVKTPPLPRKTHPFPEHQPRILEGSVMLSDRFVLR